LGEITTKEKLEIIIAVNSGKTNNHEIKTVARLLSLLSIGVTIDINDISAREANLLIELKNQQLIRQEREASVRR